jgi:alkaline phosphatase
MPNRPPSSWPVLALSLSIALAAAGPMPASAAAARPGSAIFIHPDGMGANTWMAVRLAQVGPDGRLAWDRLPAVAAYVGPMSDRLHASSDGGATTHAWGVRADVDSYGMVGGRPIPAARSGRPLSLMHEAIAAGKAVGIVNTSSVTEPGTGAFLAAVPDPDAESDIAAQILAARPQLILGGGERWFLPAGRRGVHGAGVRSDGRDLVAEARAAGYRVVHTRAELLALESPAPGGEVPRVLGLFASEALFDEGSEEALARRRRGAFVEGAPRFDEMMAVAQRLLAGAPQGFLLVGNEETTDNLGGDNNAAAVLEAGAGADRAIAGALELAARDPGLTVVVASDSDCGGMLVRGRDLPGLGSVERRGPNGAPQDGLAGRPFLAAPDRAGRRLPFSFAWAAANDGAGGLVARGAGPGATLIRGTIDSTDVYRALYLGLFGRELP